jgi:hypothetical protein
MIPEAPPDQRRQEVRGPSIRRAGGRVFERRRRGRRARLGARLQRLWRVWSRQPGFFFVAALVCVLFTFLVKIGGSIFEARDREVTQDNVSQAENAARPKPVTIVEPVQQPGAAQPDGQKPRRTLPLEEIAALNAAKQQAALQIELPPRKNIVEDDPLVALRNRWRDFKAPFEPDVAGAWVNGRNEWQLRESYHLPVDGPEITSVRHKLKRAGNVPIIEQQWWYPSTVEIPERHWKGKVAKLRFLIALQPAQLSRLGRQLRVIRSRGVTTQRAVVLEAEAFFVSSPTTSIATAVKGRPELFPAGARSIVRGDAGQLPAQGPEIDLVRKALNDRSPRDSIREVKWWPPRLNPEGHQMSKLRYEVNRNGDVKTEEVVFDYTQKKATQARQPVDLFPEHDRHTLKLEQARR